MLTPHIGYVTEENYRSSYPQIVENIVAFLDAKPIRVIRLTHGDFENPSSAPTRAMSPQSPRSTGYHVLHGLASFEEVPPDAEEIAPRRHEILSRGLPYLVAERSGRVLGYCYASRVPARARPIGSPSRIRSTSTRRKSGAGSAEPCSQPARALRRTRLSPNGCGHRRQRPVALDPAARERSGLSRPACCRRSALNSATGSTCVLMQRALGPGATAPP